MKYILYRVGESSRPREERRIYISREGQVDWLAKQLKVSTFGRASIANCNSLEDAARILKAQNGQGTVTEENLATIPSEKDIFNIAGVRLHVAPLERDEIDLLLMYYSSN